MTFEIGLTLAIIGMAVILFATEKLRVDVIALLTLLTLVLTGLIPTEDAFSGFANPAVITVWAVYIVSGGLFRTGVADILGQQITRMAGKSEPRLIAVIMLACGSMSAFMNNIGATAVLLPAVVGISRRAGIPLSRLLIPLSFSSLLGGNMTLIGTPPNVLAASLLAERNLLSFRFFDFAPTGLIVFATGILYMVFLGRHLLPSRETVEDFHSPNRLREYISEIRIAEDSRLVGKTLAESRLGADYDVTVIAIMRDGTVLPSVRHDTRLLAQDVLMVESSAQNLLESREALGVMIEAQAKLGLDQLDSESIHLVEATLAPRSRMVGRSLRETRFRDRYGFTALAIWRQGEVITRRLRDVALQFGDALLLEGPRDRLAGLRDSRDFLLLEPVTLELKRRTRAALSVGILVLVLLLVTLAEMHISVAMLIGAVLMVLTRCLTMDEAYESIEWRSVFLIAGMLPLGMAMETTGTARFLADGLIGNIGSYGPLAVLIGIYVLASLITEPMSNAAATVLMVPIAIDVALGLGADPRAFVLTTVIATSTSFLTPVGHQANVLVLGPGGYSFFDYTRVGGLLNVAILIATLVFLPMIWPLFP
jgi:di/tricarboxylate transporter